MAAEEVLFQINTRPARTIADLGGGNFAKGLKILSSIGDAVKRPWSNIAMLAAQDTVGADALINIAFDLKFNFMLLGWLYDNDTTATGVITDIKGNGYPMWNVGYNIETGANTTVLWNEIAQFDDAGWIMIYPAESTCSFEGTATNGDVVKIIAYGWNMSMMAAG